MKTIEMKISVPDGGRFSSIELRDSCILVKFSFEEVGDKRENTSHVSENNFECRINPEVFSLDEEWFNHNPTTEKQKQIKTLFLDAKAKGRLHAFTCMTIDPSIKDGKLAYEKGRKPAVGFSQKVWRELLEDYNPKRNTRQMTKTEYACKCLFIIQKRVNSGYEIDEAWADVCDNSKRIGHYYNSNITMRGDFEPTGSKEVCGFCDLANTTKLLAEDPWDEVGGFWKASGHCGKISHVDPVGNFLHYDDVDFVQMDSIGMLAMD